MMKITFFNSEFEPYIPASKSQDRDWDRIVKTLTYFHHVADKEDTRMFNLWEFKVVNGEIYRNKDNCLFLHGLVLDYDKNLSLSQALERFSPFEYVIYSTFNHGIKGDRFRVVLPFTHPMPIEEFKKKRASMIESFPDVDRASFSRAQAIFLHSGPDPKLAFSKHNKGIYIDWTGFDDEQIIEYQPRPRDPNNSMSPQQEAEYRGRVLQALGTCSGIRYIDALSMAIIIKSCRGTFMDFQNIISFTADSDSCINDTKKQQETWNNVQDDVMISAEKRDAYIKKHGGQPLSKSVSKLELIRKEKQTLLEIIEKCQK